MGDLVLSNIQEKDMIVGFKEKPRGESGWVNGGFMVLEPVFLI